MFQWMGTLAIFTKKVYVYKKNSHSKWKPKLLKKAQWLRCQRQLEPGILMLWGHSLLISFDSFYMLLVFPIFARLAFPMWPQTVPKWYHFIHQREKESFSSQQFPENVLWWARLSCVFISGTTVHRSYYMIGTTWVRKWV